MTRARPSKKTRGAVAAGDAGTAEAGAEALRAGGNAVDAAVAAAMAAFVCEIALCAPLGGGVMTLRRPGGALHAAEFFARTPGLDAPAGAPLDFTTKQIDFGATRQTFHIGRGAAAMGLALHGLVEVHRRFGALPLGEVIAPAVRLGRRGFSVGAQQAHILGLIAPIVNHSPESAALFSIDGRPPRAGERMGNPDLAAVLEALARDPEGTLAELGHRLTVDFGPKNGGLVTPTDVAAARVQHLAPIEVAHRGWSVATMPAPSTGGALIALGLRLLEGVGDLAPLSIEHARAVIAVQRRLLWVRDPDFDAAVRDPKVVAGLLSPENVDRLRRLLADDTGGAPPWPDSPLGSTTHVSALDADGGVAAVTLTNGEGCGYVLPGTGIEVNNLLGEEDINPRGFHVDPPGRPMVTMMAPTIARRPDGALLALGSGGSNRLRNAIMGVLSHVLEHGMDPSAAVAAPRLHLDVAPDRTGDGFALALERPDRPPGVVDALVSARPGAAVFAERSMFFGGVHAVHTLDGAPAGVGDGRRGGAVAVVG